MLRITDQHGIDVERGDSIERLRVAVTLVRRARRLLDDNYTESASGLKRSLDSTLHDFERHNR